jgi:hypothetical protein
MSHPLLDLRLDPADPSGPVALWSGDTLVAVVMDVRGSAALETARLFSQAQAFFEDARTLGEYADADAVLAQQPCSCEGDVICDACTVHQLVTTLARTARRAAGQVPLPLAGRAPSEAADACPPPSTATVDRPVSTLPEGARP